MTLVLLARPVFTAGSVTNVDITPATETDTAQTLAYSQANVKTITPATETDVAVAVIASVVSEHDFVFSPLADTGLSFVQKSDTGLTFTPKADVPL